MGALTDFFGHILLEEGATLALLGRDIGNRPIRAKILHRTDPTIIGQFQPSPDIQELPSLRLNHMIGTFARGCPIELSGEGFGSVVLTPNTNCYQLGTPVQATAIPDAGAFFIRWSGLVVSNNTQSPLLFEQTELDAIELSTGINSLFVFISFSKFSSRTDHPEILMP
ncbi:MAG: hypothetical protein ACI8XO_003042 [Verrucomicrobiales bacterium]|jgi:hypothetical protein